MCVNTLAGTGWGAVGAVNRYLGGWAAAWLEGGGGCKAQLPQLLDGGVGGELPIRVGWQA